MILVQGLWLTSTAKSSMTQQSGLGHWYNIFQGLIRLTSIAESSKIATIRTGPWDVQLPKRCHKEKASSRQHQRDFQEHHLQVIGSGSPDETNIEAGARVGVSQSWHSVNKP